MLQNVELIIGVNALHASNPETIGTAISIVKREEQWSA